VRANCVALGVFDAGIFKRLCETEFSEAAVAAMRRNTPLGRFGAAEEAADAIVFLASSRAGFITGQSLAVDGGYSI
jgi:NAD(P)-dependent dehydrogenase (short-subunit alcohol dehydrogenase family)